MLIFGIDKTTIFDTVVSAILIKLSLSKGGGGWRKTFKILLLIQITASEIRL
jgi:hypothetical protein